MHPNLTASAAVPNLTASAAVPNLTASAAVPCLLASFFDLFDLFGLVTGTGSLLKSVARNLTCPIPVYTYGAHLACLLPTEM
jgi:hypothetical protein